MKAGQKSALNGKTGAETARNGSSFLAMIEKMIAGTMEGKEIASKAISAKTAERGAGGTIRVPGDENILKKNGSGKAEKPVSKAKPESTDHSSLVERNASIGVHSHADGSKSTVSPADVRVLKELASRDAAHAAGAAGDADAEGVKKTVKKTAEEGKGNQDAAALIGAAGIHTRIDGKAALAEKSGNAESADAGARKIDKGDRKDKKTFISVRDERHEGLSANASDNPLSKTVKVNNDNTADMTIGFRDSGTGVKTDTESRFMEKADGKQGQSFASMLSSEIRSNAADFVKTGSIVLRDNNTGIIRLTLNPASLGNVKISLELSADKKITGKIVVSSKEAYDAFNENLDGLSEAFVKGGFESAGFDLSWSGQDSSENAKEAQGKISSPFYASSIPEVMSGGNAADIQTSGIRKNGESSINVFA